MIMGASFWLVFLENLTRDIWTMIIVLLLLAIIAEHKN